MPKCSEVPKNWCLPNIGALTVQYKSKETPQLIGLFSPNLVITNFMQLMLCLWANWLVTKFGLNSLKHYLWPVLYLNINWLIQNSRPSLNRTFSIDVSSYTVDQLVIGLQRSYIFSSQCLIIRYHYLINPSKTSPEYMYLYLGLWEMCVIPGVPEKAERWLFSTLRAESVVYFLYH